MTNLSTRPQWARPQETNGSPAPTPSPMSFGRRLLWLGPTGIVVALGLSVVEWVIVTGPGNDGSWAAALLALTMTMPVVLARRFPVAAASVVAVAAVVNGLAFDDLIRCGGAVPAALYIAFAVGSRSRESGRGWGWTGVGFAITLAGLIAQWWWDPALNVSTEFLPYGIGLALLSCGAGIGWSLIVPRISGGRRHAEVG